MNIILIGFMATGKTTIGKRLSQSLNWRYIDIDEEIEKKEGCSIKEIFRQKGERYFRKIESNLLKDICKGDNLVISPGGGAVLDEENRKVMYSSGKVILLKASSEVIYERIKSDTNRPLLNVSDPLSKIEELLRQREPYYKDAHLTIDTSDKEIEEVVTLILKYIKDEARL